MPLIPRKKWAETTTKLLCPQLNAWWNITLQALWNGNKSHRAWMSSDRVLYQLGARADKALILVENSQKLIILHFLLRLTISY